MSLESRAKTQLNITKRPAGASWMAIILSETSTSKHSEFELVPQDVDATVKGVR